MHDCACILDSIAKGASCFHFFAWCIPTSPFIQLNDFTLVSLILLLRVENVVTCMRTLVPRLV